MKELFACLSIQKALKEAPVGSQQSDEPLMLYFTVPAGSPGAAVPNSENKRSTYSQYYATISLKPPFESHTSHRVIYGSDGRLLPENNLVITEGQSLHSSLPSTIDGRIGSLPWGTTF